LSFYANKKKPPVSADITRIHRRLELPSN